MYLRCSSLGCSRGSFGARVRRRRGGTGLLEAEGGGRVGEGLEGDGAADGAVVEVAVVERGMTPRRRTRGRSHRHRGMGGGQDFGQVSLEVPRPGIWPEIGGGGMTAATTKVVAAYGEDETLAVAGLLDPAHSLQAARARVPGTRARGLDQQVDDDPVE